MVKVFAIKSADGGFGQFQIAVEGVELPQYDSAAEYAEAVTRENRFLCCAYDPDIAAMGDEDGERLAAAIREAQGNVLGGHGTIVAFLIADACSDTGDRVILESVDILPAA